MTALAIATAFIWIVVGALFMFAVASDPDFDDEYRSLRLVLCACWPFTLAALLLLTMVASVICAIWIDPVMRKKR